MLRSALALTVAALAAGCTSARPGGAGAASSTPPTTTSPAELSRDVGLLTTAILAERQLVGFTDAAVRRFPGIAALIAPVADIQRAHLERLRAGLAGRQPRHSATPSPLPSRARLVSGTLGSLETRAEARFLAASLEATSGLLAELLASIAASHGVLARRLGGHVPQPVLVPPPPTPDLSVLGRCLSAEYAAVFAYGVVGGVLKAGVSDAPAAREAWSSYDAHRDLRDMLLGVFATARQPPPVSEAAYDLPFDVSRPGAARRLARYVEDRCCRVYAAAVAATSGDGRRFTGAVLLECAERAVAWGAEPVSFPGLPAA